MRRKNVRRGSSSVADSNFWKFFSGGHFSSEQLRLFAAESVRIRADPGGVWWSPPDVRRSSLEIFIGGNSADPRGTGRSPRVSARIRACPRRKVFRRAYSLKTHSMALYIHKASNCN